MIKIKMNISENECRIRLNGHAGYNPGNDIVCAGCSAITTMISGYFINSTSNYTVLKNKLKSGAADIHIKGNAMELFEMALVGLLQIEMAYPEHVKVSYDYF